METKTYRYILNLGDWSQDGHNICKQVILKSNLDLATIQKAYKDSCKKTGVSFNHNEDFTGQKRDWKEARKYQICAEYEDSTLNSTCFNILANFGLTKNMVCKWNKEIADDKLTEFYLNEESFVSLWVWFVKLSIPDWEVSVEKLESINGFWGNLNVQFGYGLYH